MRFNPRIAAAVFGLPLAAVATIILFGGRQTALAYPLVVGSHRLHLKDTTLGEKKFPIGKDVEILFDLKGDRVLFGAGWESGAADTEDAGGSRLRVMRRDGSDEKPVTDALVRDAFFDRSGRKIYFITRDQDLFVREDGAQRLLARKILGADLSPDGGRLVYQKLNDDWSPGQLYDRALGLTVLDLKSGEERRVSSSWEDFSPNWTPDGKRILFFSANPAGLASAFVMNADGGGRRQLTNAGQAFVSDKTVPVPSEKPIWSRDGRYLLYEADREIWLNEFAPDQEKLVAAKPLGFGKHPEWTAEGKDLRVLVGKNGDFDEGSFVEIGLDGKITR